MQIVLGMMDFEVSVPLEVVGEKADSGLVGQQSPFGFAGDGLGAIGDG